jgi:hypothetical protein
MSYDACLPVPAEAIGVKGSLPAETIGVKGSLPAKARIQARKAERNQEG